MLLASDIHDKKAKISRFLVFFLSLEELDLEFTWINAHVDDRTKFKFSTSKDRQRSLKLF